jgi:hypothetical protein
MKWLQSEFGRENEAGRDPNNNGVAFSCTDGMVHVEHARCTN